MLGESCNCFCPDIRLSQAFLSRAFVPLVCEESAKSESCLVNGAECEMFSFLPCRGPLAFIPELMHQWAESTLKHTSHRDFSQLCYQLSLGFSQFWLNNSSMTSNKDISSRANSNSSRYELLSACPLTVTVLAGRMELILTLWDDLVEYMWSFFHHQRKKRLGFRESKGLA